MSATPPADRVRHALYVRGRRKGSRWRLHSTHATAEACWHAALDRREPGDTWVTTLPPDTPPTPDANPDPPLARPGTG